MSVLKITCPSTVQNSSNLNKLKRLIGFCLTDDVDFAQDEPSKHISLFTFSRSTGQLGDIYQFRSCVTFSNSSSPN